MVGIERAGEEQERLVREMQNVMTAVSPPLISVDALFTRPVSDDALS